MNSLTEAIEQLLHSPDLNQDQLQEKTLQGIESVRNAMRRECIRYSLDEFLKAVATGTYEVSECKGSGGQFEPENIFGTGIVDPATGSIQVRLDDEIHGTWLRIELQRNQIAETLSKEVIVCGHCGNEGPNSINQATEEGWRSITPDPEGLSWNYVGECPDCTPILDTPPNPRERGEYESPK